MRTLVKYSLSVMLLLVCLPVQQASARDFALTMDDPHVRKTPLFSPRQRNSRILQHLKKAGKKAMLFVCGK